MSSKDLSLMSSRVGADVIFKELRFAQSKDELFRKSTVAAETTADVEDYDQFDEEDDYEGGELLQGRYDEKNSAASFQQALMQWRQAGGKKGKPSKASTKKRSTHEAQVDTVYDSNGKVNQIAMPRIEFHSSKLTYGEKLLLKKYRRATQMNQEFFQRTTPVDQRSAQTSAREMPVRRSTPSKLNLRVTNLEIEVNQTPKRNAFSISFSSHSTTSNSPIEPKTGEKSSMQNVGLI